MEKKKIKNVNKKALALNIFSGCFGFVILLMVLSFIYRIVSPAQLQSQSTGYTEIVNVNQAVQVNILNACSVGGLAKKVKDYLNKQGIEVVSIGNTSSPVGKSYLIGGSDENKSLNLASILGIDKSMLKTQKNNSDNQIISVVIGKDYSQLKPFKGIK
ncbi:MAG: LytR C-terminal domain-containing protein [Bacteroidetes bacterium]|nr:LytR C-terminal domain-containing protein [Bacteroidota bacterium]